MPRGLGSLVAFISVPVLLQRFGARPVLFTGLIISIVALWQMSRFDLSMTAQPIMISGLIQGLGTGLLFAPLTTLAYATLLPCTAPRARCSAPWPAASAPASVSR